MVRLERRHHSLIAVVLIFLASRAAFLIAGVQYDASPLLRFVQMLDPVLLREELATSLFYLHSQPPGFNLYVGLVLKLGGNAAPFLFQSLSVIGGLVAAVALYYLMLRLNVRHWIAAALTVLFAISPSAVLYENVLFYDHAIMVLTPVTALFLHRFVSNWRPIDGLLTFSLVALNALSRSLYHPLFVVALIGVVIAAAPNRWRRVVAVSAAPLALVLLLYLKNLLVFGGFYGSSWLGATVYTSTTDRLPMEERQAMVASGQLTPAALLTSPFAAHEVLESIGYRVPPPRGVAALDQLVKTGGEPNNNNPIYIEVSSDCMHDAIEVIRQRPVVYAGAVARGAALFFGTTSSIWFLRENRERLGLYERIYNHAIHGQVIYRGGGRSASPTAGSITRNVLSLGLFMLVGFPLLVAATTRWLWRDIRRDSISSADIATIATMLITIVYVFVVGSLLSAAENSRYRFGVDPYFVALAGQAIERGFRWYQKRSAVRRSP